MSKRTERSNPDIRVSITTISHAVLDSYNYKLLLDDEGLCVAIHIPMDSMSDVNIADISAEITKHNSNLYVEGRYLKHTDMGVDHDADENIVLVIDCMEIKNTPPKKRK